MATSWYEQYVPFDGRVLWYYNASGNVSRYFHVNALGSLGLATDQTGAPVEEMLYYPFGRGWQDSSGNWWDLKFAKMQTEDVDLQMEMTPHRMYYPQLGRWMTPDPGGRKVVNLANPQTWNMYTYAGDNPTTLNDPSGLQQQQDVLGTYAGDGCSSPQNNPTGHCGSGQKQSDALGTLVYKHGVPPANGALKRMLVCTQGCTGSQLTVTSTTDEVTRHGRVVAHGSNTPHGRGEAADIRANRKNAGKILACGAECGAEFGLNEVMHPSAHATGPHVHLQITPGRNGGRGDLPPALVPAHPVAPYPEPPLPLPVSDHSN